MMDKISEVLNIVDSQGKVITFFDGKITLTQMIGVVICVAVVAFVLKMFKGAFKVVLTILSGCACACYLGLTSPSQLKDVASQIQSSGIETYAQIASASDNIRINDGSIQVKIDDKWYDLSEITSFVKTAGDKATVFLDGKQCIIEDLHMVELLEVFSD